MINKLYKLRKNIPDEYIDESPYGLCLVEKKEKVIVLEFKTKKNNENEKNEISYEFLGSHIETYSRKKNENKFFFVQVKARTIPVFPTVFISKNKQKSKGKWEYSFNKGARKIINSLEKYKFLDSFIVFLKENQRKIKIELLKHLKTSKDLWILTFTIDGKYIGELEMFDSVRNNKKTNIYKDYYTIDKAKIQIKNKFCSVCKKDNVTVWSNASIFPFYAVKTYLAPIAGGFNKLNSWRNNPVCGACIIDLLKIRSVIEKHMKYSFCGFDYFLIPEFINENNENNEIMEVFLDPDSVAGKFSLNNKTRNTISNTDGEILDILQESNNKINYTLFFFYRKKGSQEMKILLTIEDVYPSQFKEIFKAKEEAEKSNIFNEIKNTKENTFYDLQFKFDFVKEFIPVKSKKYGNFSKQFLDIVRSVFLQKKIDYNFIMHRIAESFKRKFANDELYYVSVLKTILTLKFFNKLGIIDMSTKFNEKEVIVDAKYQDFFSNHSDFFDCSSKKAVFLEGVLCQKLLNIQKYERNATPFRSKLNSLKLNPKIIQKLLPEIIEKLEQYGKNYYYNLEETISQLLLESKLDKLSNDEISFYFVMGMNLYKEILPPSEKDEEDNQK